MDLSTTTTFKMWLYGLISLALVVLSKCSEAEITIEAAFQGRCDHGSPCDQLCYELHDGMYECDCTEGYELQRNGYSCQELNSTYFPNGNPEEEDVLYQKGASFSAQLDDSNIDHIQNNFLSGGGIENRYVDNDSGAEDDDDYSGGGGDGENDDLLVSDKKTIIADWVTKHDNNYNKKKNNEESTSNKDGDKFKRNYSKLRIISGAVQSTNNITKKKGHSANSSKKKKLFKSTPTSPAVISPIASTTMPSYTYQDTTINIPYHDLHDEFYSKEDMSVYDDVNNNKLNLNNLNNNYYISPPGVNMKNNRNINNNYEEGYQDDEGAKDTTEEKSYIHIQEYVSTVRAVQDITTPGIATTTITKVLTNNSFDQTCPLDCGSEGICEKHDSEEQTARCLCLFGKAGDKCEEDTKINIPRFTKKSWLAFPALRGAYKHVQLHIEFRPESFDGIILLTGERDDLTGDFMAVLIHQGFIEFWFDCGSGTGKVRSEETVILNQWNTITIYRHRWDAWLVLNQGNRVQGRSQGLFSRITFREPVFLGGTGNITGLVRKLPILFGMVGCIRKFIANDHEYNFSGQPYGDVSQGFDVQECTTDRCSRYPCHQGGKCIPSDQGAICLCPLGFGGDLCEMRLDLQVPSFNGSSYLRFPPLGDSSLIWLELKIILKPLHDDGLLFYSGHHEYGDYISLSLNMGYAEFTFDLGSGAATVRSEVRLTMGQWHTIHISRTARLAVIKVDQYPEVMTISPNGFWHLSLPHSLFLGGVHNLQILPLSLRERGSFIGCIQRVDINEHPLSIISEALGGSNVDNCPHACVARPCGPLASCIPNLESYECQCNPQNAQCNKAEEVAALTISTPTTTTSTTLKMMTTDNDDSTSSEEEEEEEESEGEDLYDSDDIGNVREENGSVMKEADGGRYEDDILDGFENEHFEMKSTTPDSKKKTGANAIAKATEAATAVPTTTTTTTTQATTTNKIIENSTQKPYIEDGNNKLEYVRIYADIVEDKSGMSSNNDDTRKDTDEYYYEYDEEDTTDVAAVNTNQEKDGGGGSRSSSSSVIINSNSEHHFGSYPNKVEGEEDNTDFKFVYTKKSTNYEMPVDDNLEDVKQKLEVTRVNGRYMSVDNDQLIKYDKEITKKKSIQKDFFSKMYSTWKTDKRRGKKDHGACFTGADSYLHFSDAETMRRIISYQIDLNLRFKTHSNHGLILWTGRHTASEDDDFLSLGIENGYLHLRYNLGSGEVNIKYNGTKVSDGLWHRIRANRNLKEGSLEVDGGKSIVQRSPGKLRQLNTDTGLYVGGMSNAYFYTRRRYQFGIIGCISETILDGELRLNMDASTIGTAHNVEPGVP